MSVEHACSGDLLAVHPAEAGRGLTGAVVYLAGGERHALEALRDSVLLITLARVPAAADDGSGPSGGPRPPHGERTGPEVGGK
jgi:hypothetical protein